MPHRAWIRPMRPRDVDDVARASTPLELLFDLCFVVAVAQAGDRLHHAWPRVTRAAAWSATSTSSSPSGGRG